MAITSEEQFLKALKLCRLLIDSLGKPSVLPCQAITLLCEVAAEPEDLLKYNQKYGSISPQPVKKNAYPLGRVQKRLSRKSLRDNKTGNQSKINKALNAIDRYARSADNWRVIGENCNLGFGVRDHCSILGFLLKFPSSDFVNFTGNFESAELICEILQDCRGINLLPWLATSSQLITH